MEEKQCRRVWTGFSDTGGVGLDPSEQGNELVVPTEASDFMTGERMLGPQQGFFSTAFVTEKLHEGSAKNLIKGKR